MKRKLFINITMCMVMLLSVSCGQQHDAEHIVKEFMKENMKDAAAMSSLDFDRMDSTRLINDSIITSIRAHAGESGIYKTEISYVMENQAKERSCLYFVQGIVWMM